MIIGHISEEPLGTEELTREQLESTIAYYQQALMVFQGALEIPGDIMDAFMGAVHDICIAVNAETVDQQKTGELVTESIEMIRTIAHAVVHSDHGDDEHE